jgi:molybdenum cofactor cytidylyltransferase
VIPAIVLAAGRSTRMGRTKALLPLAQGETFLSRIVATFRAANVDDVVVVVGHEADAVIASFDGRVETARFVVNSEYDEGQLSSLLTGLRVVDRPGVTAALVMLVDAPLVTAATVRALVERYRSARAPIVRPENRGRHGHPVLIDRALFDALRAQDPTGSAKAVIRAHTSPAGDVEIDDEGAFADVDTPAEYASVLAQLRGDSASGR